MPANTAFPGITVHVAPDGDDEWSGRLPAPASDRSDGPLATLEAARQAVRRIKRDGVPAGGIRVELGAGLYAMSAPLELDADDGGREDAPIVYEAHPGAEVRLSGGKGVTGFSPVDDEAILSRLAPEARGNVLAADLRALGITDFGPVDAGGMELFFDHEPMALARWPNDGFVRITGLAGGDPVDVRGTKGDRNGRFHYDGDRPTRWAEETDVWVHGYWFWDWSDERHRVESIDTDERLISVEPPYHNYGYRIGQWFYAFNVLAELDRPGEWYVDRDEGTLYFWPPAPVDDREVTVSVLDNLVSMADTEHVHFRHLTFEACRQTAIVATGGTRNRLIGCTVRNVGSWAARFDGGTEHEVTGCDIHATGAGGISLAGGDRETLAPAGHRADNNHIHHYSRINRMYNPAVAIAGVGQHVCHNLIHNAPHMAVSFSGNDHAIERNEIHSVCYESNDAGAIYSGRDWTMRGTVIRHNYMHHVNGFEGRGCVGVYLDDMFCGTHICGNLFYKVTRAAFIGGGRDCTVENNIFIDCEPALHIDGRALTWASFHVDTTMKERLEAMPYQGDLWSARYPALVGVWEDEPAAPKGNVVARNISMGGQWDGVRDEARAHVRFADNWLEGDPGFAGVPPQDFALRPDAPVLELGFEPIPIEEIGLQHRDGRASWPVSHRVRPSDHPPTEE